MGCAASCTSMVGVKSTPMEADIDDHHRPPELPKPLPTWHRDTPINRAEDGMSPDFPFENLVFEGGGCKGTVYAGALEEVERRGGYKHIKRVAGASAGSFIATYIAIGMTVAEVRQELIDIDFDYLSSDPSGAAGLFKNLKRLKSDFGLHTGNRLFEYFGDLLEKYTGLRDITFSQVYERFGRDLCIIGANLSNSNGEHFHRKTRSNMPVRRAMRISGGFPVFFQAWKEQDMAGNTNVYTDGGCYSNFPIHAFDGWYLSMKPEDTFLQRYSAIFKGEGAAVDLDEITRGRFDGFNERTLGFKLAEDDFFDFWLHKFMAEFPDSPEYKQVALPDSKLSKKFQEANKEKAEKRELAAKAAKKFEELVQLLSHADANNDGMVTKTELEAMIGKTWGDVSHDGRGEGGILTKHEFQELFSILDKNNDGCISMQEVLAHVQEHGFDAIARMSGASRVAINTIGDFVGALINSWHAKSNAAFGYDAREFNRTCPISTRHMQALDMEMEQSDKEWMIKSGRLCAQQWLDAMCGSFDHQTGSRGAKMRRRQSSMYGGEKSVLSTAQTDSTPSAQAPVAADSVVAQ